MNDTQVSEEDFNSLSLTDKLAHKHWKARCLGYEDLHKKWKLSDNPSDPDFKKYMEWVKPMVNDPNAAALDLAYQTLSVFINQSDLAIRCRKEILPAIVEKGLNSTRTSTKQKAMDILLDYIYIDTPDAVIDELVSQFGHKQPKLVAVCTFAITEIINVYGIPTVDCKRLLKESSKIFQHTDKTVRQEANKMAIELYRWLKSSYISFLEPIVKPIQFKELKELFEHASKDVPNPKRHLRSKTPVVQSSKATFSPKEAETVETRVIYDAFDLAEEEDILSKIPGSFYEKLSSSNWKERKEAIETDLFPHLKGLKYETSGRYHDLVSALTKRISSDANVNVVILSATALEHIGNGLKSSKNAKHPSPLLSLLRLVIIACLEKTKEKKANVVDPLKHAMDSFILSEPTVTISQDLFEGLMELLSHKNPCVRAETLSFLSRTLTKSTKPLSKQHLVLLLDHGVKAMDDSDKDVRDMAFLLFATLKKLGHQKAMINHTEKIDKVKLAKIEELEKSIDLAKQPSSDKATVEKQAPVPLAKPQKPISPAEISTPHRRSSPEPLNSNISLRVDISKAISPQLIEHLSHSNWKLRKESLDMLVALFEPHELIADLSESLFEELFKTSNSGLLGRLLDSNKILAQQAIDIYAAAFKKFPSRSINSRILMPSHSNGSLSEVISSMTRCLGDLKAQIRASSLNVLLFLNENSKTDKECSCHLFDQVKEVIISNEGPVLRKEALSFLSQMIQSSSHLVSALKDPKFIQCLNKCLSDRNADVRRSSLTCIGRIGQHYNQYGDIKDRVRDVLKSQSISFIAALDQGPEALSRTDLPMADELIKEVPMIQQSILPQIIAEPLKPASPLVRKEFKLDMDQFTEPVSDSQHRPELDFVRSDPQNKPLPLMIDVYIQTISSPDPKLARSGLSMLLERIPLDSYSESNVVGNFKDTETFGAIISHLVLVFIQRIQMIISNYSSSSDDLSLFQDLLDILLSVFVQKELSAQADLAAIKAALVFTLSFLSKKTFHDLEDHGIQWTRTMNILLIKILEHSDRNLAYKSLLELLAQVSQKLFTETTVDFQPDETAFVQYVELLMKCIWRLTRSLQADLSYLKLGKSIGHRVDPVVIILSCHDFLLSVPPSGWKQRAASNLPLLDLPLRTIKTILHEYMIALGPEESIHYVRRALISYGYNDNEHDWEASMVSTYLRYMIQSAHLEEKKSATDPIVSDSVSLEASSSFEELAPDRPMILKMLDTIFSSISNVEKSKEGIQELFAFKHRFLKENDDSLEKEIQKRLDATGSFFKNYIQRGLGILAEEAKVSHTEAGLRTKLEAYKEAFQSKYEDKYSDRNLEGIKDRLYQLRSDLE